MTNIHLKDICLVSARFGLYMDRIRKYRAVMNMIQDKMFEYNHHTGIFTIYCYVNNRSEIIEKDDLKAWEERMMRLGFIDENSRRHSDSSVIIYRQALKALRRPCVQH